MNFGKLIFEPFIKRFKGYFESDCQDEQIVERPPLRAALYSTDQMVLHGKALASAHRLADGSFADQLLGRLADNEKALLDLCRRLASGSSEKRRITPAGEWLLDNFYLIEEQIRTAKRHG